MADIAKDSESIIYFPDIKRISPLSAGDAHTQCKVLALPYK